MDPRVLGIQFVWTSADRDSRGRSLRANPSGLISPRLNACRDTAVRAIVGYPTNRLRLPLSRRPPELRDCVQAPGGKNFVGPAIASMDSALDK